MVKIIYTFFVIFLSINCVKSQFGLTDYAKAGISTGKGLIYKAADVIPGPETIFSLGKEALGGLPFKVVASAVNQICSLALSGDGLKPRFSPDINELNFIFHAPNENVSIPLMESEKLWSHESFRSDWNITLLITGWMSDANEQNLAVDTISEAYKLIGENNFISLDTARYIDTLYTWSAFNTEDIGESVGLALSKLVEIVPLKQIHVIGHSLGAHIAGSTGRSFYQKTDKLLPRITGLDPANPCFNEGEKLAGLQRGDADFIDVIHSNAGVLGKRDSTGDVDFYPNGVTALQPGCFSVLCAHSRSWELYAETVIRPNNFPGIRCNSLFTLTTGGCKGTEVFMGFGVPRNVKGNYFFTTEANSPFGRSRVF